MAAPTPMVYYHLGLFGKEELEENCASGTILSSSLTKAFRQEDRVISSTPIGLFMNLTNLFV